MQVNSLYDNPAMVLVTYPAAAELVGTLTPNQTTDYTQYMADLQTQLTGRTDLNMHFLQLNADNIDLEDWCDAHPNADADASYAEQLVAVLTSAIPEWTRPAIPPK
jgi:hypothetical protein